MRKPGLCCLLFALPLAAQAESSQLNLHLEPGAGVLLTGPQREMFGLGLGAALKADFKLVGPLAAQVMASGLSFSTDTFERPGQAFTLGVGARLRWIDDTRGYKWHLSDKDGHQGDYFGNLWTDVSVQVVGTGPVFRAGLEAATGLELSLLDELQLGPFVKYQHIFQPAVAGFLPDDAYVLMAGLSASFGLPGNAVHAQTTGDPPAERDGDGDGTPDRVDRCPEEPGPSHNHGCPDQDSDGDGLVDRVDGCPNEPGPSFNKGCPEQDADGDGLADRVDGCPKDPGPAFNKGCPIADRDKDGVPDDLDKCPDQPETFNGVKDEDGCPDGQALAVVTDTKIEIKQPLKFDKVHHRSGEWKVQKGSFLTLAAVAKIIFLRPEIEKVWIEGHTDNVGDRAFNEQLSRNRAIAVRQHLIEVNGVDPERLEARGFAFDCPIAPNSTEAGRAKNRRVEFFIRSPEGPCRQPAP